MINLDKRIYNSSHKTDDKTTHCELLDSMQDIIAFIDERWLPFERAIKLYPTENSSLEVLRDVTDS